ncbi:hypothetical protein E4656_20095 [Natronospirillum operosum]|uniref:Uncharacterized protein n=1 Tax=Natronospirillum operosum TaxID=2759953 RepID=A0A4Z0W7X7_9GAMM|nr:hypothetical protein [Natronospirillum operosum]TGG89372.1 hypothetical protein E4656_20095 [Natronospirillum operosum]
MKSASKTQQSVQAEDSFRAATSFSGPALEQERRNTGNSNGPMNAQAQLENPKKPAGKRLFSQFNTDLNGGHADRNRGAVQAELLREGLSNSSSGDKIKLGVYSVSNLHPAGILANVANIQADIMNSE